MTVTDQAIPALPCVTLEESLPFYEMLGFSVTYRQRNPNPYAVVQRGGIHLHLYGIRALDPKGAYSTCLFIVDEVEDLHGRFAESLRTTYGKVPVAGIPRITRMRPGQARFTVVDPAGNSLIFIRRDSTDEQEGDPAPEGESKLALAIRTAARLRDSKADDAMAAKVLDAALAKNLDADLAERHRALADRVELATAMGHEQRAAALEAELKDLQQQGAARATLKRDFEARRTSESE